MEKSMIGSQVFASVGIGSLIGILLGLSSSPVVGLVVGSITAILTSLIGLKTSASDDESKSQLLTGNQLKLAGIRTGSFGFACVVGICVGIFMRTHNVLSPTAPSLQAQIAELTQIGLSTEAATKLVLNQKYNKKNASQAQADSATSNLLTKTVLFTSNSELCEKIEVDRFASFNALMSFYRSLDLPELSAMVGAINQHIENESTKMNLIRSTVDNLCEDS